MNAFSVIGLGFGDCGKGRFVDALCARFGARTVVARFNGGGQAGHTVLREDGTHHVFAQFGAGTFRPGVATLLASPVVVHPLGLLREAEVLRELGVKDALARLCIDARCRVTTPYLQAAGRLRELARGAGAHGSCGVGFGETVRLALEAPELALVYGDLIDLALCRDKLEQQRRRLREELGARGPAEPLADAEQGLLDDEGAAERWLAGLWPLLGASPPAGRGRVAELLAKAGALVFEGAQGLLLDEDVGFHPHTTWSRVGPAAAEAVLVDAGLPASVRHFGALRPYLTRHGAGPLPSEDPALDVLPEPHNAQGPWQGRFRRGQPDQLLLLYALAAAPLLDGLLASHLDVFGQGPALRWCEAYQAPELPVPANALTRDRHGQVTRLHPPAEPDFARQQALGRLLAAARPVYAPGKIAGPAAWLEELKALAGLPVVLASRGPAPSAVRVVTALD